MKEFQSNPSQHCRVEDLNKRDGISILMESCRPVGIPLAVMLSANSFLILIYGAVGITGSSIFTALFLAVTLAAIAIPSVREFRLLAADYLFVFYAGWIGVSLIAKGETSDFREWCLMGLSLAAYPACRLIGGDVRSAIVYVTSPVVALGAIATAWALFLFDNIQGKPLVFGFSNAAGTFFLNSLAFIVLAFATTPLTWRRVAIFSALIFLPTAIFAAAMVRFSFIAMVGSLVVVTIVTKRVQRKYVVGINFVIVLAVAGGLAARSGMALTYVRLAFTPVNGQIGSELPPSCYLKVDPNNSVAQRTVLVRDAIFYIPRSSFTGTGLGSFKRMSCLRMEPHNSFLQATVEFGWVGGFCLLAMVALAAGGLMPLARDDAGARFVFGALAFAVANSLVYGNTSRDMLLLGLLGWAVGIREQGTVAQPGGPVAWYRRLSRTSSATKSLA